MKPLSPSLVATGSSPGGGQVPEVNLSPSTWAAPHVGTSPVRSPFCSTLAARCHAAAGCARRCRRDRTAPCAVRRRTRSVGGPRAGRERPPCRVAGAAPRPLSVGVVHAPQRRCPMRRASSRPRPADPPETALTGSVSQNVIRADGSTAITSGRMRARRVAVQGSPLRSDRARRAARACGCRVLDGCRCR